MTKFPLIAWTICLLAVAVVTACSRSTPTDAPQIASPTSSVATPTQFDSPVATTSAPETSPLGTPSAIPAPETGKASIGGTLYTFSGQAPIPGTIFYLTPPREETDDPPQVLSGPSIDKGDIQGKSDSDGEFVLTDVPPGKYYLAVWAPYDWILAVESPTNQTPRLITLEADERMNLGKVDVAWP